MADMNITHSNFNYNNYNTATPAATQTGSVGKTAVEPSKPAENVQTGSLSGSSAAGELPYAAASIDGTDWNALTNDLATSENMMVSLSAIMTLLIQVMSQMRQEQREVSLADAQNALQSGLNAADAMKKAAAFALFAGVAQAGVSIVSGAMSAKQSASQTKQLSAANDKVKSAEAMEKGPERDAAVKDAGESFNQTNAMVTVEANKTKAQTDSLSGLGGMVNSFLNFFAESARAESKADEAQAQYSQSIQQGDQAFFQQLGDSIKAMLQTWQSADRSTHEATQAIYNV